MARLQVEAGTAIDLADGAIACTATESLTPDKPFVLRARNHQALYRFGRNPMAVQREPLDYIGDAAPVPLVLREREKRRAGESGSRPPDTTSGNHTGYCNPQEPSVQVSASPRLRPASAPGG